MDRRPLPPLSLLFVEKLSLFAARQPDRKPYPLLLPFPSRLAVFLFRYDHPRDTEHRSLCLVHFRTGSRCGVRPPISGCFSRQNAIRRKTRNSFPLRRSAIRCSSPIASRAHRGADGCPLRKFRNAPRKLCHGFDCRPHPLFRIQALFPPEKERSDLAGAVPLREDL